MVQSREERRDPQSGRIRLKYIGDCLAVQTATRGIELDPLISVGLVPSSIQEWAVDVNQIKRYMRLYMPRPLNHLLATTDVIMLSNTVADYFRDDWIHWMADSTEASLGLAMVGGCCSQIRIVRIQVIEDAKVWKPGLPIEGFSSKSLKEPGLPWGTCTRRPGAWWLDHPTPRCRSGGLWAGRA